RSFSRSRGARGPRLLLMVSLSVLFLELETAGAGRVGEGLDPAVIAVTAAVEHDLGDTGLLRALGHEGPDLAGRLARTALGGVLAQPRIERGRVREGR